MVSPTLYAAIFTVESSRSLIFFTAAFTPTVAALTEPDAAAAAAAAPFGFGRMTRFFGTAASSAPTAGGASSGRISSKSSGSFASAIAKAADAFVCLTTSSDGNIARLPNFTTTGASAPASASASASASFAAAAAPGRSPDTNLLEKDGGCNGIAAEPLRDPLIFAIIASRSISTVCLLSTIKPLAAAAGAASASVSASASASAPSTGNSSSFSRRVGSFPVTFRGFFTMSLGNLREKWITTPSSTEDEDDDDDDARNTGRCFKFVKILILPAILLTYTVIFISQSARFV